jgi:glycosyltransferase involved in cell wall biosynthesis
MSIRLLHVLEATVGGTRRHLLDLCLNLPRDRFQQHVVASTVRDEGFTADLLALHEAGIAVTDLPMRREISPRSDWQCLRALQRVIADWRPDIVHGHSSKGGFLARMAARNVRPRPQVVYNPHGFAFQMRTSPLKHCLYVQLERYAARWTDILVAACESQRQLALQHRLLPAERITVIPNGIRCEDFDVKIDREAYRRELGIPAGVTLVGTVAALVPQKGVDQLIAAVAALGPGFPDVHLALVGDGPLRAELQALAGRLGVAARVHFLGQRADVPRLLQALDVFALASLWEGFAYALLEAGAAALPVVATDIPGNRDLIADGVNGRLGLEQGLRAYMADPARAAVEARALQELVCREYTLERMIEGHVRLYEGLVGA